jgi:flagellar M-ring protein FliF
VNLLKKAKEQWNSYESWMKISLLGFLGLGISWSAYHILGYMTRPAMGMLISGLEGGEGEKIIHKLETLGISYKIDAQGTGIYIPQDAIPRTRMMLAEQQLLPHQSSGIGYELFDRQDYLGSNSFLQELNHTRALEGELARTINALEGVKSVRVHISPAEKNRFAYDKKNIASAAVYVRMHDNKTLKISQIQAIKSLLLCSIPSLHEDKMTLLDQRGRIQEGDSCEDMSSRENALARNLESLVERFVGSGHVKVRVNIAAFTDHWVTEGMEYNPDTPVVKKTKSISSVENQHNVSHDVHDSLDAEIPGQNTASGPTGGGTSNKRQRDENVSYHVSHTKTYREVKPGRIQRISVAVLVDGAYRQDGQFVDPINLRNKNSLIYVPRSVEELDHMKKLIMQAAGIQTQRGDTLEVVNLPFFHVSWPQDEVVYMPSIPIELSWMFILSIIGVLIVFSIIFTYLWVWYHKPSSKPSLNLLEENAVHKPLPVPLPQEKLEKLAQEHPEIFVQVLKNWLQGTSL